MGVKMTFFSLKKTLVLLACFMFLVVLSSSASATDTLTASRILVTTGTDDKLLKLDLDGNIIWNVDLGVPTSDVTMDPNNGSIYVVTNKENTIGYLFKLDLNGNIIWNIDISYMCVPGSGGPSNIDLDPNDASVYVVSILGPLYKFDSDGNLLWSKIGHDFQSVAVNPTDGSIYLNGYVKGVYKFDSNGNLSWHTSYAGQHNSYGSRSIAVDPTDGSAVVLSRFGGPVVKLDTNGTILWQAFTGNDDGAVAIYPETNAVYVLGHDQYISYNLYKLDLVTGNLIWEQAMPIYHGDVTVNQINGSVYVAGGGNHTLIKVDPNDGSVLWVKDVGYFVSGISVHAPPDDMDRDGIPDDQDTCPDTPSGEPVDSNGCSDSQKETGPVTEYKFDGDAQDSSGNGNHGTVYGATYVSGISGQALSFDGFDDYVNLGDGTFDNLTDVTIELWFKPHSYGTTNNHFITFKHSGHSPRLGLYFGHVEKKFRWMCTPWCDFAGKTIITLDDWYHVVLTISKTEGTKLYVNGNLDGSYSGTKSFKDIAPTIVNIIGAWDPTEGFINGTIDEVAIYNYTLSASEIKANYDALKPTSDTDGDGVPDDLDNCPNTPSGESTDSHGCSDTTPPASATVGSIPLCQVSIVLQSLTMLFLVLILLVLLKKK
jgi:outer membrane protein assembly factor BamB